LKRTVTSAAIDRRQLLRARNPDLGLGLKHPLRCDAKIKVIRKSILDEMFQGRILKDRRPLLVGNGWRRRGRRDVRSERLTIAPWHIDCGPLVVRTNPAAEHQKHDQCEQYTAGDLFNSFHDQNCRHTKPSFHSPRRS
jgi:hypothetical protein